MRLDEILCKKIFLKDGKILLGIVEDSLDLPDAKRITTAKKTYDIKNDEILRIDSTNTVFRSC